MSKIDKNELHILFEGIKHGKQESAQELYEKYKSLVYSIAFSIIKNKDDSEDVVQNTFKKIIETEPQKLPSNYEATWIYTVTKNEALQFLNKKENSINIDDIYNIQDKNDDIAKIVDCETYNKLINKLSKNEKEIISLKVIAGFSFNQIGKLLGKNTNTVKWKYYNAIYKLKLALSNISIAIISFVVGLATYKNEKQSNQIITNTENIINAEPSNTYSNDSTSMSEYADTLDWGTKNSLNEISNEVNEVVETTEPQPQETNYISYAFIAFSIVLLLTSVIIILKSQLKFRTKSSK